MRYSCYQVLQGRQVIANSKSQGNILKIVPQPDQRKVLIESPDTDIEEVLRILSRRLSVIEAEKLCEQGLTRDQVEGKFAIALHSEFSDFPPQALADPDFWRYVAIEVFRDFIYWRDGENCTQNSFGLDSIRRIPDCVPLRMFNRVQIAKNVIEAGSSLALEEICLAAGTDFWQSHVFRVHNRFDPKVVKALVEASTNNKNEILREVAKTVRQIRANYNFQIRKIEQVDEMIQKAVESGLQAVNDKKSGAID